MNVAVLIAERLVSWCFDRECWKPIIAYFKPSRVVTAEATDKVFIPGPNTVLPPQK